MNNSFNPIKQGRRRALFALGLCPLVALATGIDSALAVGITVLLAIIISNITVAALKNVLPGGVREIAHLIISSVLVSVAALILDRFLPSVLDGANTAFPLTAVCCLALSYIPKEGKLRQDSKAEGGESTLGSDSGNSAANGSAGNGNSVTDAGEKATECRETPSRNPDAGAGENSVLTAFFDGAVTGGIFAVFAIVMGGARQLLTDAGIAVFASPAGGFVVLSLLFAAASAVLYVFEKRKATRQGRSS